MKDEARTVLSGWEQYKAEVLEEEGGSLPPIFEREMQKAFLAGAYHFLFCLFPLGDESLDLATFDARAHLRRAVELHDEVYAEAYRLDREEQEVH
jgi:hypothetical protein